MEEGVKVAESLNNISVMFDITTTEHELLPVTGDTPWPECFGSSL